MMMFFIGLCATLVLSQVIGAVIMAMVSYKLFSTKWFMRKYSAWVAKITADMTNEMMEAFQDKEL